MFVPGIFFANFLENLPETFEKATPPFSNTSPFIILNSPCFHLFFLNLIFEPYSFSNCSILLQIIFCNFINHFFVNFFLFLFSFFYKLEFCLKASDATIATAIAILRDLAFSLNLTFILSLICLCISLGTPALSLPKSKMSFFLNLNM